MRRGHAQVLGPRGNGVVMSDWSVREIVTFFRGSRPSPPGRVPRTYPAPASRCHGCRSAYDRASTFGLHQVQRAFLLTPCSRQDYTGRHTTTPDDTGRHVEPDCVPGCTNLRIRCPKGRRVRVPPLAPPLTCGSSLYGSCRQVRGTPFLLTRAHRNGATPGRLAFRLAGRVTL